MQFLNSEVQTRSGDIIQVHLDGTEANVLVMDESNFQSYSSGRPYRYFGGHYQRSPVNVPAPAAGHWHVVIDLGGAGGSVKASVRVISN